MERIYLVTGAAGFLGSNICRKLAGNGCAIRAFALPADKGIQYIPKEAEVFTGDLRDLSSLEKFFDVPDDKEIVVIHCASIVTVNPEYNQTVMDVNVQGTKNIISLCKKAPGSRLVYVSSTGCIPELPKGQAIKEVGSFSPDGLMDCYSQSKALASQAVMDAAKDGLDACIVHPAGIMGPDDYAVGHTTRTLIQIIRGEMGAGISGSFNLCDVRDLADGIVAAAEKGRKGECYLLGNEEVTFKAFAKLIAEESGCKRMRLFLPGKLAWFIAKRMEKKAARTGEKPMMTTYAVYNLIRNNVFDSSKAKRELGYRTRTYRETIKDEIAWLKTQRLL